VCSYFTDETVQDYGYNGASVDAVKRVELVGTPQNMYIHLKRFKYDPSKGSRVKLNDQIEFPFELTIPSEHFTDFRHKNEIFKLKSIIAHGGTAKGGHYMAFCKIGEEWRCFNDSSVTKATEDDLKRLFGDGSQGMNAYVLEYEKEEQVT
jgi:ubiquitin C-terminal hydrolase